MVRKRKKGRSRTGSKRKKRIIRVYLYRLAAIAVMILIITLVIKAVGGIFRSSPPPDQTVAEETDDPVGFGDVFGAGEARHVAGGEGREDEKDPSSIKDELELFSDMSLVATSSEDFSGVAYDESGLEADVKKVIEDYNRISGENITLRSLKVSGSSAKTVIRYATPADYRSFNGTVFFAGDAGEMRKSRIAPDRELISTEEGQGNIQAPGLDEIESQDLFLVALDGPARIKIPGKIRYASANVDVISPDSALCHGGDGLSYIVYRKPFLFFF